MKKSDISLYISKNFTTIFDHQLELIKVHNEGTFELFFIYFLTQNDFIAKVTS